MTQQQLGGLWKPQSPDVRGGAGEAGGEGSREDLSRSLSWPLGGGQGQLGRCLPLPALQLTFSLWNSLGWDWACTSPESWARRTLCRENQSHRVRQGPILRLWDKGQTRNRAVRTPS